MDIGLTYVIQTNLRYGKCRVNYSTYVSLLHTAALGLLCDLSRMFQLSPPCVSTRVTMREQPAAEGGTVGEKCPGILPKCRLPCYMP